MSSTFSADQEAASPAEAMRRSFAAAWGEIGAAWGIAPSTATVQGYMLVSDGPLSEPEVRRALGMSHRAASLALSECEQWGLIEPAAGSRRSGQRGPQARAWSVVDDHWEWFRRVAGGRKRREADPVLPVIERCATEARQAAAAGDPELVRLGDRLDGLLAFVKRFDRGVEMVVRGDARSIEKLFTALDSVDEETVDKLWALLGELDTDDVRRALVTLAGLDAGAARQLLTLADQPLLRRLVGIG